MRSGPVENILLIPLMLAVAACTEKPAAPTAPSMDELRNATYHWARVAAQCDPTWRTRYRELRGRGHSHGRACRGIADRLLNVAMAMLKTRTLYDASKIGQRRARAAA